MPYDANFIQGFTIPMPRMSEELQAVSYGAGQAVEHEKFSLYLHQGRRFAIAGAYNIDGETIIPAGQISRKSFIYDPSVPRHIQVDNDEGYSLNPWDRGHLVRRRALHWGDFNQAELADRESSYWTNIAPQHENLHDTAWGNIEDWLFELAESDQKRLSVFVGPIFLRHDPELINKPGERAIRIPAGFWKVLALKKGEQLRAAAFITWQRDHDSAQPVSFDPVLEQVRLSTVEYLTNLSFPELEQADPLRFGQRTDIVTRGAQPSPAVSVQASTAVLSSLVVSSPADVRI